MTKIAKTIQNPLEMSPSIDGTPPQAEVAQVIEPSVETWYWGANHRIEDTMQYRERLTSVASRVAVMFDCSLEHAHRLVRTRPESLEEVYKLLQARRLKLSTDRLSLVNV